MNNRRMLTIITMAIITASVPAFAQETTSYTISWNPVTDPAAFEVRVFRSLTPEASGFVFIGSVPVSRTSYVDTGLDPGVQYWYALKTANTIGGESAFSANVSGITLSESCTEQEKDICRIVSIERVDDTSCSVTWSTVSEAEGRLVYWPLGSTDQTATELTGIQASQQTMTIEGLDPARIYQVRAIAYYPGGTMARSCAEYYTSGGQGPSDVEFVLNPTELTVPELDTADFGVRLSASPASDVSVVVMRMSGDDDITVESGGALTFGPSDWSSYKYVTLAAADDADAEDGEAQIIVAATGDLVIPTAYLTARESDDDPGGSDEDDERIAAAGVAIYPIPFLPAEGALNIENLPEDGSLGVYDLRGRRVWMTAWSGQTSLEWDGRNSSDIEIAAGRYFVVIKDDSGTVVDRRVVLAVR